MSIIRGEHNKQNPYAQINRSGLQDPNMSWEAKGLWAYFLSLPDNWQISVLQIIKKFPAKQVKIYRILGELISIGYCQRKQNKSKNRFGKFEYIIFEFPQQPVEEKQKIQKVFTQVDFPHAEDQSLTIKNDKEEIFIRNDVSTPEMGEPAGDSPLSRIAAFTVFQPHGYKLKNGEPLSYRTACSFAKYTGKALSRLKANVFWYEEYVESGKPIKRSHEALLQYAVKNDMAAKSDASFQNSMYAKLAMMENPNSGIKVLGTVVHLRKSDNSHESISLDLPTSTFANIIDRHLKQKRN